MKIHSTQIQNHNGQSRPAHNRQFQFLAETLQAAGKDVEAILQKLQAFQVAIPSWALGAGGTRFGRFAIGGEPATLGQKLEDVGLLQAVMKNCGAISLHIPWDIPDQPAKIQQLAAELDLSFDAVNSNTFQDQKKQEHSYKFGSLCHRDSAVRRQAVQHNIDVIEQGKALGSKALTVWLADGSNFPGQHDFRVALRNTLDSLQAIYQHLPADWTMLIEYKPYEPNFYSMVIPDWGTSHLLCKELGPKAQVLVDLGHHLPNTNIEQIIATLQFGDKLGGFHFNDSIYGDDDITVGCRNPYQLFLIFHELVKGMHLGSPEPAWMIDASHNTKDPLEDLIQSVESIMLAYAQALAVDQAALTAAQAQDDVIAGQELLQAAFRADLRPLVAEARHRKGGAIDPIGLFRAERVRERLVGERGEDSVASGL